MPTFEQSPCIDCLVYVRCRNRFLNQLRAIRFYKNRILTNKTEIVRAIHETVMQDCTNFCIFVAGLTTEDNFIDTSIYQAARQSFKDIPGEK